MNPSWTDLEQLRSRCHGDADRMKRYITMFIQGTPPLLQQLQDHLDQGDLEGLSRGAHGLKPQADYMGAHPWKDRLQTLEQVAAEGDRTASSEALEACTRMHRDVMRELEHALEDM